MRTTVSLLAVTVGLATPALATAQDAGPAAAARTADATPATVDADAPTVIVTANLANLDRSARDTTAKAVRDELRVLSATSGGRVTIGGGPLINVAQRATLQNDLKLAEFGSLPVTLIVLIFVFGGLIALVACHFGLRIQPNTESLGQGTTTSVVTAITVVILADAVFAIVFNRVGYY